MLDIHERDSGVCGKSCEGTGVREEGELEDGVLVLGVHGGDEAHVLEVVEQEESCPGCNCEPQAIRSYCEGVGCGW